VSIQEAKDSGSAVKFKKEVSKATGKETSSHTAFSSTFWKGTTNGFLGSIKSINTEDMKLIIDEAKQSAKTSRRSENPSFTTRDNHKPQVIVRNGTDTSESEPEV
jgi:hypothetical protein